MCRNGSSHLRGNVYVHFKSLGSAVLAHHYINGRFFAGKQVLVVCENPKYCIVSCFVFPYKYLWRSHLLFLSSYPMLKIRRPMFPFVAACTQISCLLAVFSAPFFVCLVLFLLVQQKYFVILSVFLILCSFSVVVWEVDLFNRVNDHISGII